MMLVVTGVEIVSTVVLGSSSVIESEAVEVSVDVRMSIVGVGTKTVVVEVRSSTTVDVNHEVWGDTVGAGRVVVKV